eukprot:TRINITY_DN9952_c0_g1_i2.p1 TRINITY_DN9952_c0_g1~~TRINITY_DN9952_c0_g1_i2.p1  ORF type:complete len:360 (+),score=60.01 TRINITY_DN9952_c0_g1_i2:52-1131(+)
MFSPARSKENFSSPVKRTKDVRREEALCQTNGAAKSSPMPKAHSAVSNLQTGFITSSPRRKTPKNRMVRTPSSTLFSPTYPSGSKSNAVAQPSTPTHQPIVTEEALTPVQLSLRDNVAEHGHKEQHFDQYDEDDFDPYRFIASIPHLTPGVRPTSSVLPPKDASEPSITLVLDLDETLVHCSTDPNEIVDPHFMFEVHFNGTTYQVNAKKRPGFNEFFDFIKGKFEIVVFTASQRVYADKLLDILDPKKEVFRHRVFRDSCVCVEGNYLKDLTVLGRDLSRTVIVDNSPQAFAYQLENGIPILSWFEACDDRELFKIVPLLKSLDSACDVRHVLKARYRLHEKVEAKRQSLFGFGQLLF